MALQFRLSSLESAAVFDQIQRQASVDAIEEIAKQWATTPPNDFGVWFDRNAERLVRAVELGQGAAVRDADRYVGDALDEQNTPAARVATPTPGRLVGVTADGRTIEGLLAQSVIGARARMAEGVPAYQAWQDAGYEARRVISNEIADAGRAATGVAIVSRLGVGYVRMLVPPSCSRCVVLAGRYYHWSRGFRRHPNCNCRHIPCREDRSDEVTTEPGAYFRSLPEAEQNRTFGRAAAQAIRDGANISQVVNARRGLTIIGGRAQRSEVYGRRLLTTTEGVTRRGVAGAALRRRGRNARTTPRLMPEAIYEIAENRAEAIELLRRNGYIQ
ncbi:VG15 protein [Nocardia sp. NPDC003963]